MLNLIAGKGAGGFFGGQMMEIYGGRIAYRASALICLVTAVLYALYLYIRRTCFIKTHDLHAKGKNYPYECTDEQKNVSLLYKNYIFISEEAFFFTIIFCTCI